MTLLIIFLSVTNIALGYGLAIYLGQAQIPGALGKRTTNYCSATSGEESRDARDDCTGTIDQENDENQNEVAAEAVAETADEVAKDETTPKERPDAEIVGSKEGDASDETPEVSAEQEVLDSVETIQEEIQEQPEPPTVEKASATEAESSIPESAISESQVEQETAATSSVSDEELMQGIGAFQEQLKTQQEHSKLHAVKDTSKDQS